MHNALPPRLLDCRSFLKCSEGAEGLIAGAADAATASLLATPREACSLTGHGTATARLDYLQNTSRSRSQAQIRDAGFALVNSMNNNAAASSCGMMMQLREKRQRC